eukprot:137266-Chlamydomonas_euryale.AAC.1
MPAARASAGTPRAKRSRSLASPASESRHEASVTARSPRPSPPAPRRATCPRAARSSTGAPVTAAAAASAAAAARATVRPSGGAVRSGQCAS